MNQTHTKHYKVGLINQAPTQAPTNELSAINGSFFAFLDFLALLILTILHQFWLWDAHECKGSLEHFFDVIDG